MVMLGTNQGLAEYFVSLLHTRFLDSFFFSSRRRHTRSTRAWSSDVCSSDLHGRRGFVATRLDAQHQHGGDSSGRRSEERRVGKECRSRWSPDHEKKKTG